MHSLVKAILVNDLVVAVYFVRPHPVLQLNTRFILPPAADACRNIILPEYFRHQSRRAALRGGENRAEASRVELNLPVVLYPSILSAVHHEQTQ